MSYPGQLASPIRSGLRDWVCPRLQALVKNVRERAIANKHKQAGLIPNFHFWFHEILNILMIEITFMIINCNLIEINLNKDDRTYDINLQIRLEIFCENAIDQMLLLPDI